ncbi:hypothetical protein PM082_010099 [Marasmius tenuissimus]|nr:hypothetical protein PM082_010099 [Marasmius tenuissimus]
MFRPSYNNLAAFGLESGLPELYGSDVCSWKDAHKEVGGGREPRRTRQVESWSPLRRGRVQAKTNLREHITAETKRQQEIQTVKGGSYHRGRWLGKADTHALCSDIKPANLLSSVIPSIFSGTTREVRRLEALNLHTEYKAAAQIYRSGAAAGCKAYAPELPLTKISRGKAPSK